MFYLATLVSTMRGEEWRKVRLSNGKIYEYSSLEEAEKMARIFRYKVVTQAQFDILCGDNQEEKNNASN